MAARSLPPIFQEPPDDLDSDWRHGVLLVGVGMVETMGWIELARAYRSAAMVLVGRALEHGVEWDAAHSALFLCRHTLELYLKAIVQDGTMTAPVSGNGHGLGSLGARLAQLLKGHYWAEDVERLCAFIDEFDAIDPKAMVFRFPDGGSRTFKGDYPPQGYEIWVDFRQMAKTLEVVFNALDTVYLNKGRLIGDA